MTTPNIVDLSLLSSSSLIVVTSLSGCACMDNRDVWFGWKQIRFGRISIRFDSLLLHHSGLRPFMNCGLHYQM